MRSQTIHPALAPRRRPWLLAVPLALVVVLALGWTGFWYYAASRAATALDGWRQREAQAGRVHSCGQQTIGGYPFRIEVRCSEPSATFKTLEPPVALVAKDALVAAQVYDPTLLIGEFTGPLSVGDVGKTPALTANWTLAQVSLRGTAAAPQRVSIAVDKPELARFARGAMETVASAEHLELHGRIAAGAVNDNPIIELVLRLGAAMAPELVPLAAQPTDGEITAQLSGLKDFAPKPWAARLRELQAAGGHIDITKARLAQGDILAVGAGTLSLTPAGRLDGQITLTVAGLEKLMALLGADQAVSQFLAQKAGGLNVEKLAGSLDRLMPGLGGAVRGNSGASLAAVGISMLGEQTDLEGRRAVRLPLRFADGAAFLGPIAVGQVPPLF